MAVLITLVTGLRSWGIYNCRDTALGNPSAHGDGRALDIGCDLAAGRRLVALLLRIGPSRLGIGVIIHNGVIYSAKSPHGRAYSGHPHRDHVHIELTRAAANTMTKAAIRRIVENQPAPTPRPAKPVAPPKHKAGSRIVRRGSKGSDVARLQKRLGLKVDGVFGEATERRVKVFQRDHDLTADGIVGRRTWRKLLEPR